MDNERKKYSGIEINGWRILTKVKPVNNDVVVWRKYASTSLKEIKINTIDYPYSELREPLFVDHFKAAIGPILVIGLINHEAGRNATELINFRHLWKERRDATCLKGYTISEFEEYIAGSQRERMYRILMQRK